MRLHPYALLVASDPPPLIWKPPINERLLAILPDCACVAEGFRSCWTWDNFCEKQRCLCSTVNLCMKYNPTLARRSYPRCSNHTSPCNLMNSRSFIHLAHGELVGEKILNGSIRYHIYAVHTLGCYTLYRP